MSREQTESGDLIQEFAMIRGVRTMFYTTEPDAL